MGMLGNQGPRNYYDINDSGLQGHLDRIQYLSRTYDMSVRDVIEAQRVLELARTNNIRVEAGDYLDEQIGGFGEILKDLINQIDDLHLRDLIEDIRVKLGN
jgi:hypothetical protein